MLFVFRVACASAFAIGLVQSSSAQCTIETIRDCILSDPLEAERVLTSAAANIAAPGILTQIGDVYRLAPEPLRDVDRAVSYYDRAIAAGEPWAMLTLAGMLANGEGTKADPTRAVTLLKSAHEAGLVGPASEAMGRLHRQSGDLKQALVDYEQAAAAGEPWAMLTLAGMLANGEGTDADPQRAMALLESARAAGLTGPASEALGRLHRQAGDLKQAVADYEQAAATGEPWAMLTLAGMLANGEGTDADPQRAMALLESARAAGLTGPASEALGRLHRQAGDLKQAVADYEQAAAAGEPWAMLTLAGMLANGEGTDADPQRAMALLESARAAGLTGPASEALGRLHRQAGDLKQAVADYEQAAATGEPWAMLTLAGMLANGEGTDADPQRAMALLESARAAGLTGPASETLGRLRRQAGDLKQAVADYEQAAAAGEPAAMLALADMLEKGEGTKPDLRRAMELLGSALEAGLTGPASEALGRMHRQAGDFSQAVAHYESAVATGERTAIPALGEMLAKGEGAEADPKRAMALLESAREAGLSGSALDTLGTLHRQSGKLRQAIDDYEQAVAAGEVTSMLALADMVLNGEGVRPDFGRAEELLRQAQHPPAGVERYPEWIAKASQRYPDAEARSFIVFLLKHIGSFSPVVALTTFQALAPNAKTAVVQTILRDEAIYNSPVDGLLNKKTISAIGSFCRQAHITAACRDEAMPSVLLEALLMRLQGAGDAD